MSNDIKPGDAVGTLSQEEIDRFMTLQKRAHAVGMTLKSAMTAHSEMIMELQKEEATIWEGVIKSRGLNGFGVYSSDFANDPKIIYRGNRKQGGPLN